MLSVRAKASSAIALAVKCPFAMSAQHLVHRNRQGIVRKPVVLENVSVSMAESESSLTIPQEQTLDNPASPLFFNKTKLDVMTTVTLYIYSSSSTTISICQ